MGTNSYITKLKAQLDQAIIQREHWKQLAENRNSIVVTEVCPESRSVEEYIIDADSVRASWRLIRGYREQIEALRAENGRLQADRDRANQYANQQALECNKLSTELEAARGLLQHLASVMAGHDQTPEEYNALAAARDFTATPAPEAPDHIAEASKMAEQGERQEVVVPAKRTGATGFAKGIEDGWNAAIDAVMRLNATPQPGQDVRALAASLYQACGAYDMPERILDALSAAANGEPFTHMIDGLLPCVPPSEQDVRGLVEALENCAAALAWNCFGECRAIHAGPIMPAAKALDTARAALATHRQAQRQ